MTIHLWPTVITFQNSSLLRTKNTTCLRWTISSCSRDSHHPHQAAQKEGGGAGDVERLALCFARLGDQACANHILLKAALFCLLGRSGLRFESFFFRFFFLVIFVPLLLTGKGARFHKVWWRSAALAQACRRCSHRHLLLRRFRVIRNSHKIDRRCSADTMVLV